MATARQTVSYLKQRFQQAGLRPDTRKGQNFLIDLNLLDILADAAELGPEDVVLEVGTGLGSLTALMAPRVAAVVTVEVDPHVQRLAAEELAVLPNVTMLLQDALKNKNRLHPLILETVQQRLEEVPGRRFKLVANLPYNIATPLIANLLSTPITPVSMTVTIQKELADRITAVPCTKDYSALSIWIQSQCDATVVRQLPPEAFWPRPKVNSAIVQIVPNAAKRALLRDPAYFHQLVRALFFHRRKFLRSVLVSAFKDRLDKPAVDALMAEMQLAPNTRAEELPVEVILRLSDLTQERLEAGGCRLEAGG